MILRLDRSFPQGPRLFVGPVRVHHWHWGALFMVAGFRLVWADRQDLPLVRRPDPDEIGITTSSSPDGW